MTPACLWLLESMTSRKPRKCREFLLVSWMRRKTCKQINEGLIMKKTKGTAIVQQTALRQMLGPLEFLREHGDAGSAWPVRLR